MPRSSISREAAVRDPARDGEKSTAPDRAKSGWSLVTSHEPRDLARTPKQVHVHVSPKTLRAPESHLRDLPRESVRGDQRGAPDQRAMIAGRAQYTQRLPQIA
jgi:hypothetical protein